MALVIWQSYILPQFIKLQEVYRKEWLLRTLKNYLLSWFLIAVWRRVGKHIVSTGIFCWCTWNDSMQWTSTAAAKLVFCESLYLYKTASGHVHHGHERKENSIFWSRIRVSLYRLEDDSESSATSKWTDRSRLCLSQFRDGSCRSADNYMQAGFRGAQTHMRLAGWK